MVTTVEDETVNQASALWSRGKKDITEEEYQERQEILKDLKKQMTEDTEKGVNN